jgi:GNAT superfamily N-acetyltransferase
LREGVFCAHGKPHGEEMWGQLEAWLRGDLLRGQIAREDDGDVAGFVIYHPIEQAPIEVTGEGLYMLQCLYVRQESQGKGVGKALIESALSDASGAGAWGLAAETWAPGAFGGIDHMPSTFFQHMGMTAGEARGPATLYYTAFRDSVRAPRYIEPRLEPHDDPTTVRIDILDCRRCHIGMSNRDIVTAVVTQATKGDLKVHVHDQNTRQAIVDKGMSSGVFIDG